MGAYNGEQLPVVSVCKVQVEQEGHEFVLDMTVVKEGLTTTGVQDSEKIGLVKRIY